MPYVSEIRLKKACHLLLQRKLKIIDVALESGHGSLAHFNYVFKKRFHMTPTEWRVAQTESPRRPPRAKALQMAAAMVVWLLLSVAGNAVGQDSVEPSSTNAVGRDSVEPSPTNTVGRDSVEPSLTNTVGQDQSSRHAPTPAATNAAAPGTFKPKVDRFEVLGNTLLATNLISSVLAPYTGDAVDLDGFIGKITNAIGALQLEYFHRGWFTVKVAFPSQKATNGSGLLQVTEGKLAAVRISGNRYFSSNNIMAKLPYVKSLALRREHS